MVWCVKNDNPHVATAGLWPKCVTVGKIQDNGSYNGTVVWEFTRPSHTFGGSRRISDTLAQKHDLNHKHKLEHSESYACGT